MQRRFLIILVSAALVVVACAGGGGATSAPTGARPTTAATTAGSTPAATMGEETPAATTGDETPAATGEESPAATAGEATPGASPGEGIVIDPEAVTGTVRLSGWQSSPAEEDLLAETVAAFETKYPNITVSYEVIPTDYNTNMIGQFSAHQPPDVFYVQAENTATAWMEDGVLEPLDPYITGNNFDTSTFYPSLLSVFQKDGVTYGLPKDAGPLALFYNTDMLTEASVEPPTTWDELSTAAAALTTDEHAGLCIAPELPRVAAFMYQNGGGVYNEDKTELTIASPESVAAIDYYLGLHEAGSLQVPSELGATWCGEAFGLGKAAMVFEGTWLFPPMETDFSDINFGVAELPVGVEQANLAFTNAYGMGVDSANKEAGWVLLSYLTGPEGMAKWTSLGLALPARTDVPPPADREVFTAGLEYGTAWAFGRNFPDIQSAFNNELTRVIAEGGTGQDVADAAAAAE